MDEQVVAMKLVTPARGTLELSEALDPELFRLARVGLGLLGVVSQVTLQCYPAHTLLEHTFVASLKVSTPLLCPKPCPFSLIFDLCRLPLGQCPAAVAQLLSLL